MSVKRRAGIVIAAVLLVVFGGVGLFFWTARSDDRSNVVDVDFGDLGTVPANVRISGTAHYVAHVKQHVDATLFSDARTVFSYGLFPKGDVSSKEIKVLVRTDQPLSKNIDFDYLELEGVLELPTRTTVPFQMERVLGEKTGYFFSPDILVLRPWIQRPIEVGGALKSP